MKSVYSEFLWSVFSTFGLNTEYFSIFSPNARKCGPENLQIPTLFTQCQLNIFQVKNWKHDIDSLKFWGILWRNLLESHLKESNSITTFKCQTKRETR